MFCPVCRAEYPGDWKACPKDAAVLLRSSQLGKYTIEGLLGVGGMGAVYRAFNPDTHSRVAIKVMNPAVAGADSARVRFQREAAAVAALNTTHVVKVYDFGTEADGTLYLVMELLDGHQLRDEITVPPQAMDLARVQMVMEGSLRGLAAAHKAGIVHRDLKPENIFVAQTDDGEVPKLVDFGIARVRTHDSNLTRTGTLVGTASYMAPEQVAAGQGDIGPWSDVYAMGTILYELLAGQAAFGGDSLTEVLGRVLRAEIRPLVELRPGLPAETYRLIARCMSTDMTARPQDADALRRDLIAARLVVAGTPIPVARIAAKSTGPGSVDFAHTEASNLEIPSKPAPSVVAPAVPGSSSTSMHTADSMPRRPKKPPVVPIVLAGLALLGGGIAIVVATRDHAPPAPIVVVVPDARASDGIDASVATIGDAPPMLDAAPATMVTFAAGPYEIGVKGGKPPDELPLQTIQLHGFAIDLHELTKAELASALGADLPAATATKAKADPATAPARFVDAATARAACTALGKRLPTEAEWEAAARTTPQDSKRARLNRTNSDADLVAPSTDCSEAGLCDMLGSVLEWTSTRAAKSKELIVRGASYRFDEGKAVISIHNRQAVEPGSTDNELGFRCVKDQP